MSENREHRDALASVAGAIEALHQQQDSVSTEYLKEWFNETLEDKDIESEVFYVE